MKFKYEAKVVIEANVRSDEDAMRPIEDIKSAFLGNGLTNDLSEALEDVLMKTTMYETEAVVTVEKLYASVIEEV